MDRTEPAASAGVLALAGPDSRSPISEDTIRAEQVRLLHGTPYVWLLNPVVALLAAWLLRTIYPLPVIAAWFGLLSVIIAARLVVWLRYGRGQVRAEDASRWGRIFTLGTFATGAVWGLLAATFFLTDNPTYHVFVVFVLGGMTAGAALRDSAYLPAFYAFAAPALMPTIAAMLIKGGTLFDEMSAMLLAFASVLALMGRANAERIADNIRLQHEQDGLIDDLEGMSTHLKQTLIDREETAAALQASNERLRSVGENAQDAIVTVDVHGRVVYWNPAAERIFGYRADEIIGRNIHEYLTPERFRKESQEAYAEFARTDQSPVAGKTLLFPALHKDGHEFPMELSVSSMRIGGEWQVLGIARDVTERDAAEAALKESEAALKDAQHLAHVGSWRWNLNTDTATWSEELYRIMRMDPAKPPPHVRDLPESMKGENSPRLQALMAECRTKGTPFEIDLELRHVGGGQTSVSLHGEAVRGSNGKIIALRGTLQDITQRKATEAALRESEAALKDAQRLAHIGSWVWELGSDDIQWSQQLYQILCLDPAEPPLRVPDLPRIMASDSITRLQAAMEACTHSGEPFALDLEMTRTDGSQAWVSLRGEAMRNIDDKIVSLRGTLQDITERKAAESALQESEARLREAQRMAHIGSWERPIHGNASTWSDEIYRMFGLPPSPQAPALEDLSRFVEADSLEHLRGALLCCLRDGTPFVVDLEARHSNGRKLWISVSGEVVRDESGDVIAMRGTVQDITERKNAEQNIAKLHQQMAENIETLQRHDEHMRAIAQMNDLLQACQSRREAFPIIAATAQTLFPKASGALALVVSGTHQLETAVQWGDQGTMQAAFSLDDCWALRTGRRYDLAGPDKGAHCHHYRQKPTGPSVCLPLTAQGQTTGLLHMDCVPGNTVDEAKQGLMTSFADVIKLSLANLNMREILSDQALRDQLTTLFNRHYLAETLPREIHRALRDKLPLSLAILDIDHFKQFNDHFGHDAGDAVLKAVGEFLRDGVRGGDIACRYGGEEFLLVLPECDADDALTLVEQLREKVKLMPLALHDTPLPAVTISAGIAELGGALTTSDAMIAAADRALYAAKKNGRDRVEMFTPEMRADARLRQA